MNESKTCSMADLQGIVNRFLHQMVSVTTVLCTTSNLS
jgi:hypothetical protein